MDKVISRFQVKGEPVQWKRFGCGHINETYIVSCDSGLNYILQRINKQIFKKPEKLMENICAVTAWLSKVNADPRAAMHVISAVDGKSFYVDDAGEYWRMYDFVSSTVCLQKAERPEDLYYTGLAFGQFQNQLTDFPAETLNEAIKDFHNTKTRFVQLHDALKVSHENRLENCQKELDFALARECEAGQIIDKLADGQMPLRVTHNDTKLNNILFDYDSRTPLCIIDLDTVMPGSALYDYGDAIRFGASTAAEDEKDLDKVWCDMELFRTYTKGFLEGCGKSLTKLEIEMLPVGAKLMTLECGIRFLADYLNGDTYFRIHYEDQNLDRARTQFKLVADMEHKWQTMQKIIKEILE